MLMRNFWLRHVGFIVLVLVALSAAVGSGVTAQTTAPTGTLNAVRPAIQAQLNGTALPGAPSSYCWPQPGQTPCALVDNPQPSLFTPVKPADTLTFSVAPSGEPPSTLIATLLDDT